MTYSDQDLRELIDNGNPIHGTLVDVCRELLEMRGERDDLTEKLSVLQRRTSRHSLAKDLGQAVEADAVTMARIVGERDDMAKQLADAKALLALTAEYVTPFHHEHLGPDELRQNYATWAADVDGMAQRIYAFLNNATPPAAAGMRGPRWIPCTERLPDPHVAVFVPGGCAYFISEQAGWHSLVSDRAINWEVTHWQPLPSPPTATDAAVDGRLRELIADWRAASRNDDNDGVEQLIWCADSLEAALALVDGKGNGK